MGSENCRRRLGEYIEQCDERNYDNALKVEDVRGISTAKEFIGTKANMVGVDISSYKIVRPTFFSYVADTSRRGNKIALALNKGDKSILVSSIYTTFKIKDTQSLLPDYLNLFLNRGEFDRYARFNSWGSARETFDWDRFCDIELPIPPIETQRKLTAVYNGVESIAEQNEALVEPLMEACHAFVVDCKGKYDNVELGEYVESYDERNHKGTLSVEDVHGISTAKEFIATKANMEGVAVDTYKVVLPGCFAYVADTSRRGDKMALAYNHGNKSLLVSSIYTTFRVKDSDILMPEFLLLFFKRDEFDRFARFNSWGSARETFDWEDMRRVRLPLPPLSVQRAIVSLYLCAAEARALSASARRQLGEICSPLMQWAARSL